MNEIRQQNLSLYPSFTPYMGAPQGGLATMERDEAPGMGASPLLAGSTPLDLMSLSSANLPSDPQAAATLLQFQSGTAASITNPSGSGEASGENPLKPTEQVVRGADSAAAGGSAVLSAVGRSGGRLGKKLGFLGPGFGFLGEAAALPSSFGTARDSITKAWQTGQTEDIVRAGGDTAGLGSGLTGLAKGALEVPEAIVRGQATRSASAAFRTATPGATKAVIDAAARKAADEALKSTAEQAAIRSSTKAAKEAAKAGGTLASGAGTANRATARVALREGGEAAAKAAGSAVGRSALKTAAKAGARFVPGLNIGIAAFDTAAAGATLADPKASVGKKATSVVTAAGSIVAATNIPIVSQVGAAVSAVSSFVGSFF